MKETEIRTVDIERDAEPLAAMWMASDEEWPGTWSSGVPISSRSVRERFEREDHLEVSVIEDEASIVAYCDVKRSAWEPSVAEVAFLNVVPTHQGRSFARKMLRRCVDKGPEWGISRIDLYTWSANLKAVPLYKKTGFFWRPDTSVEMLNFIPAILAMPFTNSFFERRDWYVSFKRELSQEEDDERWRGMKVFTYRFEGEDGDLTVWVDAESRAICAVESRDIFAAAVCEEQEPARGLANRITWEVTNKTKGSLPVSLIATGSEFLSVEVREAFKVGPEDTRTIDGSVEVAAEIPRGTLKDWLPAPSIRSILVIEGIPLELSTGMRPKLGVEVKTNPSFVSLDPGGRQTVSLMLRNRTKKPLDALLSFPESPILGAGFDPVSVPLPPEGFGGTDVDVTGPAEGLWPLPLSVSFDAGDRTVIQPPEPLAVFVAGPSALLVHIDEVAMRIENGEVRAQISKRGGSITFTEIATGRSIASHSSVIGPPFYPNEFYTLDFDLSFTQTASGIQAVATAKSRRDPGLAFTKVLEMSRGPVVRMRASVQNLTAHPRRFQLRESFSPDTNTITLPFTSGVVRGLDFPGPQRDEFRDPGVYAEAWAAFEPMNPGIVTGVLWPDDSEEVTIRYGFSRLTRFYDCGARSSFEFEPLECLIGGGDWKVIRKLWMKRNNRSEAEIQKAAPEPKQPINVAPALPALITSDDSTRLDLTVERFDSRKLEGSLRLVTPDGWEVDASEHHVEGVDLLHPVNVSFEVAAPSSAGSTPWQSRACRPA